MLAPQGLDARAVSAGKGFALYMIDAGRNNSKFYEGLMLPNDDGTWRVMLRWGALTDSGFTGRIDGGKFDARHSHLSEREAKGVLAKKYRAKTGKGYVDAWKHKLPKGQYPVGLKRDVGFGWGVQDAAFCIPALRQIQQLLRDAQGELGRNQFEDASSQLDMAASMASRQLRSVDSTMATKIKDNIAHMQGRASALIGGDVSDRGAIRNWTTALSRLISYLDKQMSVCHGKVAFANRVARENPVTMIFSTKAKATAFRDSLDKNEVRGKFSVRKTKGWKTYSLVFTPHAYADTVAIAKLYKPEKPHYKDIADDVGKKAAMETPPEEIGKQKKPDIGEGAEAMKDTDQSWLHEVADAAKSPTAVWDGEGYPAKTAAMPSLRRSIDRIAHRVMAARS